MVLSPQWSRIAYLCFSFQTIITSAKKCMSIQTGISSVNVCLSCHASIPFVNVLKIFQTKKFAECVSTH
jgi:hypothetical protein